MDDQESQETGEAPVSPVTWDHPEVSDCLDLTDEMVLLDYPDDPVPRDSQCLDDPEDLERTDNPDNLVCLVLGVILASLDEEETLVNPAVWENLVWTAHLVWTCGDSQE